MAFDCKHMARVFTGLMQKENIKALFLILGNIHYLPLVPIQHGLPFSVQSMCLYPVWFHVLGYVQICHSGVRNNNKRHIKYISKMVVVIERIKNLNH